MTFYRHFCERPDFEVAVISDDPSIAQQEYNSLLVGSSPAWERLARTRLSNWVHGYRHRFGGRKIEPAIHEFVERFEPEAVFTVGGAWSWLARLAERVATRNRLPLIGSFNDWWNYNQIYPPRMHDSLHAQFIDFYQRCDLAICTSEGMEDALGQHRNSVVLYPTGAGFEPADNFQPPADGGLKVGFGGNLGDWYGRMVQGLVEAARSQPEPTLAFEIYGSRPSWSAEFDQLVRQEQIFHGQVDFQTLTQKMRQCNVLLLPMGFDAGSRQIESTSFKTKFLDYLTFEKPIFVWGPEYCSAVRTAREFDSAEVCTDEDPQAAASLLSALQKNPQRQSELVANARAMYNDRFHPDTLHRELVARIYGLTNG